LDLKFEFSDPCEQHSLIANHILHALPQWFDIEEENKEFCEVVKDLPMIVIYKQEKPIGFCALRVHYGVNCELYVLGVIPQYHRCGLGSNMIEMAEDYCRERQIKYLTVKTLSERSQDAHYVLTRRFYRKNGFRAFDEFPELWDEANPCLYMIKEID